MQIEPNPGNEHRPRPGDGAGHTAPAVRRSKQCKTNLIPKMNTQHDQSRRRAHLVPQRNTNTAGRTQFRHPRTSRSADPHSAVRTQFRRPQRPVPLRLRPQIQALLREVTINSVFGHQRHSKRITAQESCDSRLTRRRSACRAWPRTAGFTPGPSYAQCASLRDRAPSVSCCTRNIASLDRAGEGCPHHATS